MGKGGVDGWHLADWHWHGHRFWHLHYTCGRDLNATVTSARARSANTTAFDWLVSVLGKIRPATPPCSCLSPRH